MRLIDADRFIKWLDVGHLRHPSEICLSELNVKQMIDLQPTIEAEPVRYGEWEVRTAFTYMPIDFDEYGNLIEHDYDHYVCRLCGRHVNRLENYCPDCGAKMDGGSE